LPKQGHPAENLGRFPQVERFHAAGALSRLLNGKAGVSAAMAIRLAAVLGTTPELWMNMQY
jgi:addiction module HigA family antidote